jgi:shikimate dehydrogenase
MRTFGIIGYPLDYTLSPAMHNAAFQALGMTDRYDAYPVRDVRRAVDLIREKSLCGVSVTIPHKTAIAHLLDGSDGDAARIGAVNTVIREGQRLVGYNTDWIGAVRALEEVMPMGGKSILIMGAGGSARAVAYAIGRQDARLWVANRDEARGKALARSFDGQFLWPPAEEAPALDAVINATPVLPPLLKGLLKKGMVVMDLAYGPQQTALLKEARRQGCRVVDGRRMLLFQGQEQFRLWTGKEPPLAVMEKALYRAPS